MTALNQQLVEFGFTIALGLLIGVLFDFYRVFNRLIHPSRLVTRIGDLLFWLLLTGVVFFLLLLGNQGEVRAYVILGLVAGIWIHLHWFSRTLIRVLSRVFGFFGRGFRRLVLILGWPVCLAFQVIAIPYGWVMKALRWLLSPIAKKFNAVKARVNRQMRSIRRILLSFTRR